MYDYDLIGKKTKLIYGVASKKLIELGNNFDKDNFENILTRL